METNDTVRSRFEPARTGLTPLRAVIWALVAVSFNPGRRRSEPSTDAGDSYEALTISP
ncbi:hypothetical protein [Natronorubrum sp. DTA28]|uniref:hypothetical protein n=1 Tax=Natronorubrum sp. DTA28 TaxID=3447019 RepID=UPI003F879555